MSRAVPPLETFSRGRQQVSLGSGLIGLQWRFSQSGAVWCSANVASQPRPCKFQDDAAPWQHTASSGSSRGLHKPLGLHIPKKDAREEEENEVRRRYCVGKSVAKKQRIKSLSMGPAQHKQFHCLMVNHFINYKVPLIKLECPALEWVQSTQAAPCKQPFSHSASSSSTSTSTSTSRRFWWADRRREQSVSGSNQLLRADS